MVKESRVGVKACNQPINYFDKTRSIWAWKTRLESGSYICIYIYICVCVKKKNPLTTTTTEFKDVKSNGWVSGPVHEAIVVQVDRPFVPVDSTMWVNSRIEKGFGRKSMDLFKGHGQIEGKESRTVIDTGKWREYFYWEKCWIGI